MNRQRMVSFWIGLGIIFGWCFLGGLARAAPIEVNQCRFDLTAGTATIFNAISGQVFNVTVCETTTGQCPDPNPAPGIVGVSLSQNGPFTDSISGVPVVIGANGTGSTPLIFYKPEDDGETTITFCHDNDPQDCLTQGGGPLVFTVYTVESLKFGLFP